IYCNNDIKFNGGSIKIKTDAAGTETAKADAVKAKGNVEIGGGDIDVNAAGDGIKSSKNAVVISDGKTEIKSGKDAIQGETAVTITGGEIVASGDRGITVSAGNLTIGGGTLLATSTEAVDYSNVVMGEHFSNSNIVALALNEQHNKSEVLTIAGKEFTAAKKYQYIFATYPDLAASSANVLLIDGKKAEFTVVPVGK
ncbi:MAG: carbohydrate-binding domain-containing protein, partial [Oscillospiraceae bacterium]|nr:carbohydrate-binding domain-containing protein [Oscillospiraceae bacterium]